MELASPRPKDLVVVVDRSGSMLSTHNGRTLMDIAIDAAKTVINTLNPNDRVSKRYFITQFDYRSHSQIILSVSTFTHLFNSYVSYQILCK